MRKKHWKCHKCGHDTGSPTRQYCGQHGREARTRQTADATMSPGAVDAFLTERVASECVPKYLRAPIGEDGKPLAEGAA